MGSLGKHVAVVGDFLSAHEASMGVQAHFQAIVGALPNEEIKKESPLKTVDPGQGWCILSQQSFQTPRGTFDVEFISDGKIILHGKSSQHVIEVENIEMVFALPSHVGSSRLMLALRSEIQFGKSKSDVLLATPKPSPKMSHLSMTTLKESPNNLLEAATSVDETPMNLWKLILSEHSREPRWVEPDLAFFSSSTSKSFVKCFYNVQDGLLFPLKEGLIFINKPALFLRRQSLSRLEIGQGAGKTFSLLVSTKDGTDHEIKMIEKDEKDALSRYLAKILNEANADCASTNNKGDQMNTGGVERSDDESSEADSNFTEESDGEQDAEKGDEEGESSADSDRESDIDKDDIDLTKEYELDMNDTIAVHRKKRKVLQKSKHE